MNPILLRQKWEGAFAQIFNYSCTYAPKVPCDVALEVNNHNDSSDIPEEQPAALLNVYCGLC